MFRKIIIVCCVFVAIIGCDRVSQNNKDQLIPRSVLQASSDRFCVSMNYTGDKISYLARKGKDIELRVEDLSGNLLRKFDVKECRSARNYCWATTGEHILIQQDNDGDENDHIICLDIKTGTSKDLTPFAGAKSGIDKLSKKYPHEIIIYSNKRDPKWDDVYRVNIITGKTKLIFKNAEYTNFYFDHDFNLRVATKIVPGGDFEDYLMKERKPEFLRKIPYEDAMHTRFYYFDADNVTLYGSDLIGRDKGAFVAYNLQNKTSKMLFESDLADVRYFTGDPNTFAPQAFSVEYLKREIFVTDKSISKDVEYLKSRFDGKCFEINGRNYADDTWLVTCSGSDFCAKYYIYKRDPKKRESVSLKFLFSSKPLLDKYRLQKKEPVVIKSRDGLDLVCYLTKSCDFQQADPRKLVVFVHGGPSTRDSDNYESTVQLLANRGYSVLQINYRGSVGFGKKFANAGNCNFEKIRDDIIDGVNWAIANKIADKDYIAIMGGSFGGDMALSGITFSPDVFRCGINIVGGCNFITFLETLPESWAANMDPIYKLFGDPRTPEGRRYLIENSPITHVDNIKKPLLMFLGKNDPRSHISDGEQIVAAMKKRNLPVVYVLYPDEGHGFLKEQNNRSYIIIIELFLAKIMGGRCEPIHPGELDGSCHQILEGKEILGLR